jgi:hypothetical protein
MCRRGELQSASKIYGPSSAIVHRRGLFEDFTNKFVNEVDGYEQRSSFGCVLIVPFGILTRDKDY